MHPVYACVENLSALHALVMELRDPTTLAMVALCCLATGVALSGLRLT